MELTEKLTDAEFLNLLKNKEKELADKLHAIRNVIQSIEGIRRPTYQRNFDKLTHNKIQEYVISIFQNNPELEYSPSDIADKTIIRFSNENKLKVKQYVVNKFFQWAHEKNEKTPIVKCNKGFYKFNPLCKKD